MNESEIPQSPVWLQRQWDKLQEWYCKPRRDFIFVIQIDEVGNFSSDWCEISKNKTVDFDGHTYDSELAKYWHGRKTLLILKGLRQPPDFSRYETNFVDKSKLEGQKVPLSYSSRIAYVKMNSRYAYDLAMGLKDNDLKLYATLAGALFALIAVALLMDYLHMPMFTEMHNSFSTVINQTRR